MVAILQAVFSGLALGSIYALVALGFNITHNTTKTLNFGQGEFLVAGAFVAVSGVLLWLAALAQGTPLPTHLSMLAWASLGFQIVIVTALSYLVWFWLIRTYPATRLASFTLLTPVFGLLLGAALLGEPITARLVVALAAVATGIVLVNRR